VTYKVAFTEQDKCDISSTADFKRISNMSPGRSTEHSWLASPGFVALLANSCEGGSARFDKFVNWNRFFTFASSVLMVFLVRFLTSSWVLAVIVGAALLSRGELLVRHGLMSHDGFVMLIVCSWFAFASHFFKTAASFSLYGMLLSFLIGGLLDKTILFLGFSYPIFCLILFIARKPLSKSLIGRRNRSKNKTTQKTGIASLDVLGVAIVKTEQLWVRTMNQFSKQIKNLPSFDPSVAYKRGTVFSTLTVPFSLWILQKKRWLKVMLGWLAVFLALGGVVGYLEYTLFQMSSLGDFYETQVLGLRNFSFLKGDVFYLWLNEHLKSVDFYFALSVSVILACILTPPHPHFVAAIETIWFFIFSFLVLAVVSFVVDSWDYSVFEFLNSKRGVNTLQYGIPISKVFYWFEPVILTLGIVGMFYLAKSVYLNEGK
jgi:hypothetical protein